MSAFLIGLATFVAVISGVVATLSAITADAEKERDIKLLAWSGFTFVISTAALLALIVGRSFA